MPELPEMQALSERLAAALESKVLIAADPLQFSALKTFSPTPSSLAGQPLQAVGRRGKYLVLDFTPGRMLVHLSQGGRVDLEDPPKRTKPKGAVLRLRFDAAPSVLVKEFGSERKAAWWVLERGDEGPLAGLGPEPFSRDFEELIMTSDDRRRVHTFLRDQRAVAGIGRGFSDDILHEARLSPYASMAALTEEDRRRLVTTTRSVLQRGLERERERTGGLPTKLGDRFLIHGRAGRPCPRCGADIRRVSYEGYEIAYCPTCQTGGRVLADRRMSRLLK